jgi:manganese/zinc/iron transport system permease protein
MILDEFYIIITGISVAVACALIGCVLVLRKMAMLSDAISHAVLPGIVAAYLISGTRNSLAMLVGAMLAGVLCTSLVELLHKKAKLQTDSSIGVTFTWLFALGVILLTAFAGQVDLDQDCVLYGEIALTPFDVITLGNGLELGPRSAYVMFGVIAITLVVFVFCRKELFATSFDPSFSEVIGIKSNLWNQVIMALVSITTIAAFDAVGAILVVALMVVPPAAAYLLTVRLNVMIGLSLVFGIIASVAGYYFAALTNSSVSGSMVVIAGLELAAATALRKTVRL